MESSSSGPGKSAVLIPPSARAGVRIDIRGVVQGVGFRPWVYRLAVEGAIDGTVRNDSSGVHIEAFGSPPAVEAFLARLRSAPPAAAEIQEVRVTPIGSRDVTGFAIIGSGETSERMVSIPPDLAVCEDCLKEIFDRRNRRFRYPFTNCTNCGPRFTIALDVPYDRGSTTMAPFRMCPDCRREYEDVTDRRFHAQPNACPVCGPRLRAIAHSGAELDFGDPVEIAAEAIRGGRIVAIKGLGGFHLACDATSEHDVLRLRRRKRRDEKPFAVMVPDLAAARAAAFLTGDEERLLTSVQTPIVLVRRKPGSGIAESVAPNNALIGLMLPYTPLHHLLIADAGTPLVMTSGNLSEEPIVYRNEEVLQRLGGVADLFLLHDRLIETRCDDSVVRVVAGSPMVLRRSRGYVPRPLQAGVTFAAPILACGAHLKNTFAIAAGDFIHLGPHIGDLENLDTLQSYEEAIERMERFLCVRPEIVAYDLHPRYLSTDYALARSEATKIPVQHHHAHIAGVMSEHAIAGPVLGLAWDGTGYGLDETAWGGELLLAEYSGFERLATLHPIALAGGDAAIRQVWRSALALLDDAYDGQPPLDVIPLFQDIDERDLAVVLQMIRGGVNTAQAHGAGRYFDAFGAIFLGRSVSRFEGQVALEWNLAADEHEKGSYPFEIDRSDSPWRIDLRPALRAAVEQFLESTSPGTISGRFHNTLAAAASEVVRLAALSYGKLPVVLSGGCFQNSLLAEKAIELLSGRFEVHMNRRVPPGDGGIAFGQAVVAGAIARSGCDLGSQSHVPLATVPGAPEHT